MQASNILVFVLFVSKLKIYFFFINPATTSKKTKKKLYNLKYRLLDEYLSRKKVNMSDVK